jgi:hypothetical protein
MSKILDILKSVFPWITPIDLSIIFLVFFSLILILALYVYFDSKTRGGKSLYWFIGTLLFLGIIPFIFYLMVRSPFTLEEIKEEKIKKEVIELQKRYYELMIEKEISRCPVCGEEVRNDYLFCPHCFTQLKKRCGKCGSVIEKDAKICPYCGNIFEEGKE